MRSRAEIRNPLHAITASSHYLVEFFRRSLSDHQYMDQIELNMLKAELMTMKINIMLDAAKAKAGKLEVDRGIVTVRPPWLRCCARNGACFCVRAVAAGAGPYAPHSAAVSFVAGRL